VQRPLVFVAATLTFLVLLALMVWQGSFSLPFGPSGPRDTIVLGAVSTLIFLLAVTLAFMLFRAGVKAYIERQQHREGSRIRSKILFGALALTLAPTLFSALFNYAVLNRTLDKWFTMPVRGIEMNLQELDKSYRLEAQARVDAEASWISLLPQTRDAAASGRIDGKFFKSICEPRGIRQLILSPATGVPMLLYQRFKSGGTPVSQINVLQSNMPVPLEDGAKAAHLLLVAGLTDDLSQRETAIQQFMDEQKQLAGRKKFYQDTYFLLICLLTLFVLFFASWSAQILSRQISVPISALLGASQEVRRGNLSYRIRVNAVDEMAALVRAFNEMTSELEGTSRELDTRRRFTEAILESIPTGVISLGSDERIERVNRALAGIFSQKTVETARRLSDLFSGDDLAEIRYLLRSARRAGTAACQFDLQRPNALLHLAVTAASLEETRGFVMVIEDTSDLLRAQKSAAWQEVARRIAHEIKNPLTPISLCADRIARQLLRVTLDPTVREILDECTQTIQQEVLTVKTLVDEFAQFSRFPSAQPVPADLNEIVRSAMAVFAGRLSGIDVTVDLDDSIPTVMADYEQIKRVIVNLIDNAAEAMTDSPVRSLTVRTAPTLVDTVELSVTDTGMGVSRADKEKLFLPYFSTKGRGTGLGLAIVSHIIKEHQGNVRVEENQPRGARFVVELNPVELNQDSSAPDGFPVTLPVTLKV
jgi:nitrogen fixation/metabolism regulation signal transduction histidine kinase